MKRSFRNGFATLALAVLGLAGTMRALPLFSPVPGAGLPLNVDLWTSRGTDGLYRSGEAMDVYFRTSDDCYVTVYNIDTDGRVSMLFPRFPDDGFVYGGMTYRLPDYYDAFTLRAEGPRGVGYIHAVVTREPGAFRHPVSGSRYLLEVDPVTGDPFLAINAVNDRLIPQSLIHATATASYFVESRVWYPRYLCSGCHQSRGARFDPYTSVCPRYSVVLAHNYDYWWMHDYHPAHVHFVFGGPFWRFEIRTGPYGYRHHNYLTCAWGYSNYRPVAPPARAYAEARRSTPVESRYREYEREYSRVRYSDTRERRSGSTESRTRVSGSTTNDRLRDDEGSTRTVHKGETSTRTRESAGEQPTRTRVSTDESPVRTRVSTDESPVRTRVSTDESPARSRTNTDSKIREASVERQRTADTPSENVRAQESTRERREQSQAAPARSTERDRSANQSNRGSRSNEPSNSQSSTKDSRRTR